MTDRLRYLLAALVGAILTAAIAVGVPLVSAQLAGDPCEATRSGDIVTVDLSTCEAPTATTTTAAPTTSSSTTTTLAPTTTLEPTTTTAPTTTVAPTTTGAPATTAPPAAGLVFVEDFATEAGFYDRFDYGFSGYDPQVDAGHIATWHGDHDLACGNPTTTHRDVAIADKETLFWWCPTGTGHLMTSVNTLGYNIAWFSPAQWFTNVNRVCWDQNVTHLGGRKWINVALVARSDVEHYQANPVNGNPVGTLDLGFTDPDFRDPNGPTTRLHPLPGSGTVGMLYARGWSQFWDGDGFDHDWGHEVRGDGFANEDVATRYEQCFADNGDGTISISQTTQRGTLAATADGAFPDGQVRVVFLDDNYDPPKDGEYDPSQNTWHWDNIEVYAS